MNRPRLSYPLRFRGTAFLAPAFLAPAFFVVVFFAVVFLATPFLATPFLAPRPSGPRRRITAIREKLDRTFRSDAFDRVALAKRCVGGAIRDVRPEPALLQHDGAATHRIRPELPQRGRRRAAAAPLFGLRQDGESLFQCDRKKLFLRFE